jgi:hypothetical protein
MDDPFEGLGKSEMERRIADARLSERDAHIARLRLLECMYFADIAAEVGCDRRTAARGYKHALDVLSKAK